MTVAQSDNGAALSASSTLTPNSPTLHDTLKFAHRPALAASDFVELVASRPTSSSAVFVYDLAEQAGFGSLTKSWSQSGEDTAPVIGLQTRAGAGLSLVGRLSQGTSRNAANGSVLTAYTSPTGLAGMIPSLIHLPSPTSTSRLVVQVPTVTPIGEHFSLSPTLAPLAPALSVLPNGFVVLLSATPQETVDLAAAAYKLPSHVIHLFDHHSSAREVGPISPPQFPTKGDTELDAHEVIQDAGYTFFDYAGADDVQTVFVTLNGPLARALTAIADRTHTFGVLVVRVLRPWDEAAFQAALPASVKEVRVVEDIPVGSTRGILHADVMSSLFNPSGAGPVVYNEGISPLRLQELLAKPSALSHYISGHMLTAAIPAPYPPSTESKLLFFSTPGTALSSVSRRVEQTFANSAKILSRLLTEHDVFSKAGGITADRIVLSSKEALSAFVPLSVSFPVSSGSDGVANFLAVLDQSLLKTHTLLSNAKSGSIVLIATSWSGPELVANLHADVVTLINERHLHLCTIDSPSIASKLTASSTAAHKSIQSVIVHLAFLRLYFGVRASEAAVLYVAKRVYGSRVEGLELTTVHSRAWAGLVELDIPAPRVDENTTQSVLRSFDFNAIAVALEDGDTIVNGARLGSWHDAAQHLLFPSAFTAPYPLSDEEHPQLPSLRPEVPDRTFLVTCTVNRRLTPKEYDRNVFHLEFDTSSTGLKYAIGEALGVHGWNDEADVLAFCEGYSVDPSRLITIPVPNDDAKVHTRTVFQALQQQIDLFGKPPKSFYWDLAKYASSEVDKHALLFIGSPEGASTFKKLSEKDTVSFAEVLQLYPSARPGIEVLCELIGDIKPRHYSIASSQSVVGDRVDLLVVTVDWVTPGGSPRYGQCTRYLAGLKLGQKVTVSIKPSVMKLPPDPTQPLIMAGLGTGAAPFRAFLQHRALLASQNVPLGPVYYYFGSRHQSQEYLYGEEIQAFIEDGVITKAGLAFSRDGPKKVYIQHKMVEDVEDLVRALYKENGVFYLCGPTWPVPDVYETLIKAFVDHQGLEVTVAADFLEGLKEEERYVLEVY
ncbi:assimilatory sulfite reductase [Auriscalpium vulgare]|uniref:Assimilatory sulfite reductase n=1 Tax=Auriscalpium vulgare TaxID=40419 RepID=A0ACB8S9S5_9AGAM|nr:assimilatory sulfite reductase [Auriscalpium vulgare]